MYSFSLILSGIKDEIKIILYVYFKGTDNPFKKYPKKNATKDEN